MTSTSRTTWPARTGANTRRDRSRRTTRPRARTAGRSPRTAPACPGCWPRPTPRAGGPPPGVRMARCLWREQDLALQDTLAREDWREYTPGPITPHYAAPRADGRPFPAHSPGLPLLLAPLYALGGRPLCVAVLTLMAA